MAGSQCIIDGFRCAARVDFQHGITTDIEPRNRIEIDGHAQVGRKNAIFDHRATGDIKRQESTKVDRPVHSELKPGRAKLQLECRGDGKGSGNRQITTQRDEEIRTGRIKGAIQTWCRTADGKGYGAVGIGGEAAVQSAG